MPNCLFFASTALALALTLTAACNPEPIVIPKTPDAGPGGTGTTTNNATGSTGTGGAIDAGNTGGPVVPSSDAGNADTDGALADSAGGSLGDGGGVANDGGVTTGVDAAAVGDAGADGGIPCTVKDPRFGCGTRVSPDWVHFASGLDIDTKYGRAWSPVINANSLLGARSACSALVVDRLTNFEAPEVDDVRTLAAGCAATVPGGSCAVESGVVLPSESGNCICGAAIGPNQGKFCRPEVPECQTLWTVTECGVVNAECPSARSWFYDVRTGSLVLAGPTEPLALEAKTRCVAAINYRAP